MNQFSADDERTGHQRMLDAIRAEQIQDEPEPTHEPWWTDDFMLCQAEPIARHWCCDWHRLHQEDA